MKCPGCGADVMDGAKTCGHCGRELSLGTRTMGEGEHIAHETGVIAGKIGRGAVTGVKGFASGVKKGFKGEKDEKKETETT